MYMYNALQLAHLSCKAFVSTSTLVLQWHQIRMQSDEREYPVTQNAKEIKQEISIIELNISFLR